jgi:hypothetical protein
MTLHPIPTEFSLENFISFFISVLWSQICYISHASCKSFLSMELVYKLPAFVGIPLDRTKLLLGRTPTHFSCPDKKDFFL